MSLITRCPACETLFRVVPDQLRISDGWVRCGQCDEIFDASLHLLPATPSIAEPVVWPQARVAPPAATDGAPVASAFADIELDIDLDLDPLQRPVDLPLDMAPLPPPAAGDEYQWTASSSFDSGTPAASEAPMALDRPASIDIDTHAEAEAERKSALSGVSFLRANRVASFWHRRVMRVTLLLLAAVLLLGLAAQGVLHERDRLLAFEPRLQPWLQLLCEPFNCRLSALRQIESIVIDGSSFTRIRGDAYRLDFTLKNAANTALAVPAMELTLTDALDQAVLRRVLTPSELGVASDTLAPGADWSASVALAVQAGGAAERIAGYRLLAFYP